MCPLKIGGSPTALAIVRSSLDEPVAPGILCTTQKPDRRFVGNSGSQRFDSHAFGREGLGASSLDRRRVLFTHKADERCNGIVILLRANVEPDPILQRRISVDRAPGVFPLQKGRACDNDREQALEPLGLIYEFAKHLEYVEHRSGRVSDAGLGSGPLCRSTGCRARPRCRGTCTAQANGKASAGQHGRCAA